jgi:hypothetical protein
MPHRTLLLRRRVHGAHRGCVNGDGWSSFTAQRIGMPWILPIAGRTSHRRKISASKEDAHRRFPAKIPSHSWPLSGESKQTEYLEEPDGQVPRWRRSSCSTLAGDCVKRYKPILNLLRQIYEDTKLSKSTIGLRESRKPRLVRSQKLFRYRVRVRWRENPETWIDSRETAGDVNTI